jgi:hypothetical protein
MDELAFPIDICDLQVDPFQQAQPAGVDGGETHVILLAANTLQHTPYFCNT